MSAPTPSWEFWIDRGGTFTDVVARSSVGEMRTLKLLSDNPRQYSDAATAAITRVLGIPDGAALPAERIASVKMGTTVATNALLQRRGEPTLLVVTKGFADVLRIGYQTRPHLFKLDIERAEVLCADVVEVTERVDAHGNVLVPLDVAETAAALRAHHRAGIDSVAIVLLHGYRHCRHEALLAAAARDIGFSQVSVSHEVNPLPRIVPRGDTTVVDAYLSPVLRRYVRLIATALSPGSASAGTLPRSSGDPAATQAQESAAAATSLQFMQSSGGLADASRFAGKDALLSGPAGGVVGMIRVAQAAGFERLIGFDMGGTSTDVSHFAGELERRSEAEIAGVRVRTPLIDIHTVAAGGGSRLTFDGTRLRVGPHSAGADPGPVCYGNGGPLAVTDANVALGLVQADFFPAVFGADGRQPLDAAAAERAVARLADEINAALPDRVRRPQEVAFGFCEIAADNMANAIKKISTQRGHDVTACTLVCFGGAGGQHACRVADRLGITEILVHPWAGVLSAVGIGLADMRATRESAVERPLTAALLGRLRSEFRRLGIQAAEEVASSSLPADRIRIHRRLALQYAGSDTSLWIAAGPVARPAAAVGSNDLSDASEPTARLDPLGSSAAPDADDSADPPLADVAALIADFEQAHRARFGFMAPDRTVVVEALAAEAVGRAFDLPSSATAAPETPRPDSLLGMRPTVMPFVPAVPAVPADAALSVPLADRGDGWRVCDTPFYDRSRLSIGAVIDGPAVIVEQHATTVVEPGWQATLTPRNDLVLRRVIAAPARVAAGTRVDPIRLEIFNNLFMNIAEQMGIVLEHTAVSVNIKERLDFSCAIFDPDGALIANAPHLPVHLGSMSESIRTVIEQNPDMAPGDVFVLNNPYNGGTHLPDITVVRPVFASHDPADRAASDRTTPDGAASQPAPLFYVASRGHHADVGGCVPGSAPADSVTIHEEGLVIDNVRLVADGCFLEDEIRAVLASGPWPARNPDQNVADLKAQVAACERGASELLRIVDYYGLDVVHAYMGHVTDNAEESVRRVIDSLHDGEFVAEMDDGSRIAVRITVDRAARSAVIDFTGTSAQHPGNFNAPLAVCRSAVLYVFRCMVDDDIPLNAGCLRPLRLVVPDPSMLSPHPPAAVIAGNVETSQQITDALFGALGVVAASQGTMNNVIWGNDRHQYYETVCGGAGATARRPGADAVHTHMTNTRLTDPEIIEQRHPVLIESFAVRRGSGGDGVHRGGDGVVRRIRFREPMTVNILSSRRRIAPFGTAGGGPGATGRNLLHRADGTEADLGGCARAEADPGDVLEIRTPGGGGYGAVIASCEPSHRSAAAQAAPPQPAP